MTNNNNMIFAQLFIALMHIICTIDALSINRRHYLQKQTGGCIASLILTNNPASAQAANEMKSRTDGYAIQHTEREWAYILSGSQYNILRRGGTERQKSSILNTFTSADVGIYTCAGCNTSLQVLINSRVVRDGLASLMHWKEE